MLEARGPQYGGSNITPLRIINGGDVNIPVINLANGSGAISVSSNEEVSLVVTNMPDTLYLFNAFKRKDCDPDRAELNYQVQVQIIGAQPRDL